MPATRAPPSNFYKQLVNIFSADSCTVDAINAIRLPTNEYRDLRSLIEEDIERSNIPKLFRTIPPFFYQYMKLPTGHTHCLVENVLHVACEHGNDTMHA